jgi:formylglycine-generating enzyme required for sulfatase activity
MLHKGHQGVQLGKEDWDRLVTWIDLNAPCHGTWGEVFPIPGDAHGRRMALRAKYGGPKRDPEVIPELPRQAEGPIAPKPLGRHEPLTIDDWPLTDQRAVEFTLPTEAQWEYACRAGSAAAMSHGRYDADFSRLANLADATFARGALKALGTHPETVTQWSGGVPRLVLETARLADDRSRDGASVTTATGSYQPNPWGLFDMHGNAVEWTRSLYRG